jgi:hypothetical protein
MFTTLAAKYGDLLYVDPGDAPVDYIPVTADALLPSVIALLAGPERN